MSFAGLTSRLHLNLSLSTQGHVHQLSQLSSLPCNQRTEQRCENESTEDRALRRESAILRNITSPQPRE